jgi:ribosomal protein S18 acetylase RimI-like enzyme
MNHAVTIRHANTQDVTAMCRLLSQLFVIEQDFVPDPEKQQRGLTLLLDSTHARLFVAEQERQVVGMLTVQLLVSTAEGGTVGLIEDVVVDEAYRGQGIGKALLQHLETWAQNNGLTRLQLLADRNNRSALRFYEKSGWQTTELIALRRFPS